MDAPSLDLDWELGVFRALRGLWRWAVPQEDPFDLTRVAKLEDHLRTLEPLAQLIAGEAVRVRPGRVRGGVRGRDLLVPAWLDLAEDPGANRGLYVLRVVHAAQIRKLSRGVGLAKAEGARLRESLRVAVLAAEALREELGRFGAAWDEACVLALSQRPDVKGLSKQGALIERARQEALQGRLIEDESFWTSVERSSDRGLPSPPVPLWGGLLSTDTDDHMTGEEPGDRELPDGTEKDAPPVEDVTRVLLDHKEAEKKVVQHSFEKIETLDAYDGNLQMDDGSDELDEHLEALEEVELRELLRGGQDAHSLYKVDLDMGADIPQVERISATEVGVPYDEWDYKLKAYRPGWCTVYPTPVHRGAPGWEVEPLVRHRRLIDQMRRLLERQRSGVQAMNRQRDGEHPDIDALVEQHAEVMAGRTGTQRVYIRQARKRRHIVTTVLLDVSLSADSWVDNRRVLDVSREACLVLGEVAETLGDPLQILAFASSTRNRCRVWTLKDWKDSWRHGRDRLGAIEPQGYTRIGPALRHATAGLASQPADGRLLLLISDGKPNDYDKYEGRYGVADIRMALREAERKGVMTHALAVDETARGYLPPMFGAGRWHVVSTPDAMHEALTVAYGKLTGQ
jgi:nitric oxide reductase NorD protein